MWSPAMYASYPAENEWDNTNSSWIIPGHTYIRGNAKRTYSEILNLADNECYPFFNTPPLETPFERERIAIVTHGFCGSTCACKYLR